MGELLLREYSSGCLSNCNKAIFGVQKALLNMFWEYLSLWQKVLPLNPGMFVYSYLFFVLLQLHKTVVAFIQYALMSS